MSNQDSTRGFRALGVADDACRQLRRAGIVEPTPIQSLAIPIALAGEDLIGIAQTGTGKTLAFGLPMAETLRRDEVGLVLAPTRELAQQIAETFELLQVRCALVVGGQSMTNQERALRSRPEVIVATPGRLEDHLQRGTAKLDNVGIAVLDEADRMLDMGFAPAIRRILDKTPANRQTMLFSATFPQEIQEIADRYLYRPQRVEASREGSASERVAQELVYVEHADKQAVLAELVAEARGAVLVFARTRHGARKLAKVMRQGGHHAAELHADRTPAQRKDALQGFKDGRYRILVATDIASRGIDVADIELVVNYDVPEKPEDYVHRIGRTGRAGADGRAVTIAIPAQEQDVRDIEKLLGAKVDVSSRSTAQPHHNEARVAPSPRTPRRSQRPTDGQRVVFSMRRETSARKRRG
ncbi:MAG: DEAD/DEAH box helicase [Fimbriimonadaceae bacterium]